MGSFANNITGGQNNNANFTAQGTNILQPTTVGQAQTAYGSAQDALTQQQQLAQALQSQGAQGMASQSQLTNALQQQAMGQGPNPAQAQLAQATGTNVANQAALMAGQRGAAGNVGLMARQNAQQGAATQQQAVGQAATLGAQQQIAAQQQLQGLAATQVGQQSGAVSQYNQAAQGEQGNILNSINAQNAANVGMQSNINNANAALAQTNANNTASTQGGLLGGIGSATELFAKGGTVPDHIDHMAKIYHPHYAFGGPVESSMVQSQLGSPSAIGSSNNFGSAMDKAADGKESEQEEQIQPIAMNANPTSGVSSAAGGANQAGGPADQMVAANPLIMAASEGGKVPGKAKMKGDHLANDTVDAKLSPGEVVIPKHVMESDDPVKNAADFVAGELKKHGKYSGDDEADFKEGLKRAIGARKKK